MSQASDPTPPFSTPSQALLWLIDHNLEMPGELDGDVFRRKESCSRCFGRGERPYFDVGDVDLCMGCGGWGVLELSVPVLRYATERYRRMVKLARKDSAT